MLQFQVSNLGSLKVHFKILKTKTHCLLYLLDALLIGPVLHHITCVITPLLINNFEQIKKSYRRDWNTWWGFPYKTFPKRILKFDSDKFQCVFVFNMCNTVRFMWNGYKCSKSYKRKTSTTGFHQQEQWLAAGTWREHLVTNTQIFACSCMTIVVLCKPNSFLENPLVFTSFSQIKMAVIQCDFM